MVFTPREWISWSARRKARVGFKVLGRIAKPATATLAHLLRTSRSPAVRQTAAESLAAIGLDAQTAAPALTDGLHDPDATVREACTRALMEVYQF
jgi:HEAT repeat protein